VTLVLAYILNSPVAADYQRRLLCDKDPENRWTETLFLAQETSLRQNGRKCGRLVRSDRPASRGAFAKAIATIAKENAISLFFLC
jgi:hypothetical protein